jgi:hypothetical protein
MAVTIVEEARPITGGVDTHADTHVAAALDFVGGLLGVREFPATAAGYSGLLGWLGGFGTVCLVGIEGTGSYGAGLARHVTAAGIRVVEVDRSDRQDRRRQGKSDLLTEHSGVPAGHRPGGTRTLKLLTCSGPTCEARRARELVARLPIAEIRPYTAADLLLAAACHPGRKRPRRRQNCP